MAKAIGLATGLLGACDVILRSTTVIIQYISDVKNAPAELKRLQGEVESLEAIMGAVRGLLSSKKAKRLLGARESAPISKLIEKCEEFVCGLESEVKKTTDSIQSSRLLWPVIRGKQQSSLQEISRFITMLHLTLSLDGWGLFFQSWEQASVQLQQLREDMAELEKAAAPLAEVQKTLQGWDACFALLFGSDTGLDRMAKEWPDISASVMELSKGNDRDMAAAELRKRKELLEFLCSVDGFQRHLDVAGRRQKGTATWLVHHRDIQRWVANPSGLVVWCYGIPGCGKSVLFSAVVDHFLEEQAASGSAVAAVYLRHDDAALHNVQNILAVALRQIAGALYGHKAARDLIDSLRKTCKRPIKRKPTAEECINLLAQFSELERKLYVCFDALDEIPEHTLRDLMRALVKLQSQSNIGILLTSRHHFDANVHQLVGVTPIRIEALEKDISLFLESKIDESVGSKMHDEAGTHCNSCSAHSGREDETRKRNMAALRQEIVEGIVIKSGGMFLLADMQIRELETTFSVREIRDVLSSPSKELNAQYAAYMSRILGQARANTAISILAWVYASKRHLGEDELLEALSIRVNDTALDSTGILSVNAIIKLTEGLVTYDTHSRVFRLAHGTLRTYLDTYLDSKAEPLLANPHSEILQTLSTYLRFHVFDDAVLPLPANYWMKVGALQRSHKLLKYALLSWGYHVDMAQSESRPAFAAGVGVAIANRIAVSSVLRRHVENLAPSTLHAQVINANSIAVNTLDVAALFDSLPTVEAVLDRASSHAPSLKLGQATADGTTTLHIASVSNSTGVAQRVLRDQGLGASWGGRRDAQGRTPLLLAAMCGSSGVLELLVAVASASPDVSFTLDAPDNDMVTPLHAALRGGHVNCANMLLRAGADINATTLTGQSPLHYAVQYCPELAFILSKRADVDHVSNNGRTTLHWACDLGRHDLIKDIGTKTRAAALNSADRAGSTPLHILAQAKKEHIESALYLISVGADPGPQDKAGFTPLHHAIRKGYFQLARHLLASGASPDVAAVDGSTPLLVAAAREDCPDDLWEILAAVGLSPPYGDPKQWPLHQASLRLNAAEVRGLISRGANVSAVNGRGESPLYLAACRYTARKRHSSHVETKSDPVSVLLHHRASPTQLSGEGLSPLHVSLIRGNSALLRDMIRFIRPGELESHVFPSGESILQYAALHSSLACLELVVRLVSLRGAQKTERDSPLALAVRAVLDLRVGAADSGSPKSSTTIAEMPSYKDRLLYASTETDSPGDSPPCQDCITLSISPGSCEKLLSACGKVICLLCREAQDALEGVLEPEPEPPALNCVLWEQMEKAFVSDWKQCGSNDDDHGLVAPNFTQMVKLYLGEKPTELGLQRLEVNEISSRPCGKSLALAIAALRMPPLALLGLLRNMGTVVGTSPDDASLPLVGWTDRLPIITLEQAQDNGEGWERRRGTHLAVPHQHGHERSSMRPSMVSEHPTVVKLKRYEGGWVAPVPTVARNRRNSGLQRVV
ncbi:hypothetical protein B0T14DRAFT_526541 [Immersiella caudata]|uniref:Ankyrin repeat protein n=1 Tax=Immersiella caudata TaxID=314043 RepID=A0AA39WDW6_9PEZI|nr:hypothetical protein B0T14DRAFT_526541 [Immersiella caudata]